MMGLAINPRKVVHETVDGETILIHLETGNYYSLTGAGAEIWALVAAGWPPREIASGLAERHGRSEREVSEAVDDLLGALADEGLLEPNGAGPAAAGRTAAPAWETGIWAPPKLEKYEDMQNFLLIDPIHEVDDIGWPTPKAG